ncbi:FecR domain-containing protein [Reichenbachiella sp. MALMAid0571]|uniref:FecR family protein n=1 Tax=Reichenbachiella sp. MALMAid0571 TaxID=3143939 RepID=UPI0032DE8D94
MKEDINYIIAKELSGNATMEEIEILRSWLGQKPEHRIEYNFLRLNWIQKNESIKGSKARVFDRLAANINESEKSKVRHLSDLRPGVGAFWLKVAASIVLVSALSFLFYENYFKTESKEVVKNEIITKETPKGVKRQIVLPDGTDVWLNSGSSLSYASGFTDSSRIVRLVGEAFFEVTKDPKRPFQVESGDIVTTAIGTAFNVNAFSKSSTSIVSLTEGKVKVEYISKNEAVYLTPGYAAVLNKKSNQLDARSFDIEEDIAWKDGILVFKNAAEEKVLRDLENWYGVKFTLQNKSPEKWDLTTRFENESLEHVLKVIGFKAKFNFQIEDKKVTIEYLSN